MSAGVLMPESVARLEEWPREDARSDDATRTIRRAAIAMWLVTFAIYLASPVLQMSDSKYSMLTAESIVHNHTPDLSRYSIQHYDADLPFNEIRGKHPYQLERVRGRLLYGFPHGTSILSIPFIALMDLFHVSPATSDGQFDLKGEVITQKLLAAMLMASVVVIFFRTALLLLDWRWSALVAIAGGLGTQVWSSASRGMWSHTWEITLAGLVVYLLLASEVRGISVRPIMLATLLSWMFFVRPTASGPIICVSAYVLIFHRRKFLVYAATGTIWLIALAMYSTRIFGTVFPDYYQQVWGDAHSMLVGIFGTLFSPSRGLFVYCPMLAVVFYILIRNWHALASRRLAILSMVSSLAVLLVVASHMDWWGGNCYGPRYLSDTVPWLVMLAIMAMATIPTTSRTFRNPAIAIGAFLLLVSIVIQAHGAYSFETLKWNDKRPLPDVMLDWSQPQFLAGWIDEN
jgi:hypothetical protein